MDDKAKNDSFGKFHLKQWLVVLIASIIWTIGYGIVYTILAFILAFIPVIGWLMIFILGLGFWLPIVFCIQGLVYAIQGKQKEIMLVGHYASKFNF